jgi:hypothetical protein
MSRYTHPSAGLVSLHQRETQRLPWQIFFGRALRAGTGGVEVGGAETFVDTGRHIGTYAVLGSQTESPPMLQWQRATRSSIADLVFAIYHQSSSRQLRSILLY